MSTSTPPLSTSKTDCRLEGAGRQDSLPLPPGLMETTMYGVAMLIRIGIVLAIAVGISWVLAKKWDDR